MAAGSVVNSGVEVEKKTFTWNINNFAEMTKHLVLINSQESVFQIGESIGLSSRWRIFLQCKNDQNRAWIGICLEVLEKPAANLKHLIGQLTYQLLRLNGSISKEGTSAAHDWNEEGCNVSHFVKRNATEPLVHGNLVARITFQLFSCCTSSDRQNTVEKMLDEFHNESRRNSWEKLAHLLKYPVYNGVEIVSKDGKKFQARKEVLIACSPYFDAMFRSGMIESRENKVELKDISCKTVEVLLHYFYNGELLPAWREREVVTELTNSAAKYDLKELLCFLDCVLGKVCVEENVADLLSLVEKVGLSNAERELMSYVRVTGVASSTSFVRMMKAVRAVESTEDED